MMNIRLFILSFCCIFVSFLLLNCATMRSQYDEARRIDSIEMYEKYLENYPDSSYNKEIKNRIMELNFEDAMNQDTTFAYKKFLEKYPYSQYSAGINKKLIEIMDKRYEQVMRKGTTEAYTEFLEEYPNSPYNRDIQIKITIMTEWNNATKEDNMLTYKKFVNNYPNSIHVEQAKKRIKEIPIEKWEDAKNEDTILSYQKFIAEYKDSKFIPDAKKRIKYIENIESRFITVKIHIRALSYLRNWEEEFKDGVKYFISTYNPIKRFDEIKSTEEIGLGTLNYQGLFDVCRASFITGSQFLIIGTAHWPKVFGKVNLFIVPNIPKYIKLFKRYDKCIEVKFIL